MKYTKIALVGELSGVVLILSSWLRYFVIFPDLDRALAYGVIGALIVAVSFLYDKLTYVENTLLEVEDWIQSEIEEHNLNKNGGK